MSLWVVEIKGAPDETPFEISVLRADNVHGRRSYGWYGGDKIMIADHGGPCRNRVPPRVWTHLVGVAHAVAEELNREEAQEELYAADPTARR